MGFELISDVLNSAAELSAGKKSLGRYGFRISKARNKDPVHVWFAFL